MYAQSKFIQTSVSYSLTIFGIFKNPEYRLTYATVLTCYLSIFATGSIVGLLTCPGTSDKLTVLSITTPVVAVVYLYIDIFMKRQKLIALLAKVKNYSVPPAYILSRANIIMKKKLFGYIVAMVVTAILSTTPSTLDSFQDKPITPKYSLIVPYWFTCHGYNRTNLLGTVFCFQLRTKAQLLVSNSLQCSMGLSMFIICCAGLTLYSAIIYELLVHVDIFKSMIRNLSEIMNQFNTKSETWTRRTGHIKIEIFEYQQTINDRFVAIIKYQQFLKSCIIDIVDMWRIFCAAYVVNYFLTVALLIFIIVTERDDAALLALRAGSLGVFAFTGFLLNCIYGHLISNMNEIVFDELCTIPWYEQNTKFRKLYAIALAQNRKAYRMKVANMVNVDLIIIITLIRTTFSMLNLVLALQ